MKAKPILMHGRSIRSLLAEQKTQTRRIVKRPIRNEGHDRFLIWEPRDELWRGCNRAGLEEILVEELCPYGLPGDLLYVRETWCQARDLDTGQPEDPPRALYRADGTEVVDVDNPMKSPWKPSIHMPRWASRITLHLTDVRLERVQEITEDDAKAEGAPRGFPGDDGEFHYSDFGTHYGGFAELWEHTNGHDAWDRNDWCWCLHFRVIEANVDDVLADPARYGIGEAA